MTCWRRLRDWEEDGIWDAVWWDFIATLDKDGLLDWQECSMAGKGLPVGDALVSAPPAELKLVIQTLADMHA